MATLTERLAQTGLDVAESVTDEAQEVVTKEVAAEIGFALAQSDFGKWWISRYPNAMNSKWTSRIIAGILGVITKLPFAAQLLGSVLSTRIANLTPDGLYEVADSFFGECRTIIAGRTAGGTTTPTVTINADTQEKMDALDMLLAEEYGVIAGVAHLKRCAEVKLRTRTIPARKDKKTQAITEPEKTVYDNMEMRTLIDLLEKGDINLHQRPRCCGGAADTVKKVTDQVRPQTQTKPKRSLMWAIDELRANGNDHAKALAKEFFFAYGRLPENSSTRETMEVFNDIQDWEPKHVQIHLDAASTEHPKGTFTLNFPTFIWRISIGKEVKIEQAKKQFAEAKKPKLSAWEQAKADFQAVAKVVEQTVVDEKGPVHDELDRMKTTVNKFTDNAKKRKAQARAEIVKLTGGVRR
ncbi:MAG: hypothetical protein WC477_04030 [Patescibacteria group bacterium]